MKTKHLFLFLFFLLETFAFSSCNSDDEESPKLGIENLPTSSQEFLTKYFPDNKVVSVSLENPQESSDTRSTEENATDEKFYYVLLEGQIYVSFNHANGIWNNISAETGIPSSATKILDEHVYRELMQKESPAKIVQLSSFDEYNTIITLNNKHTYAQSQLLAYEGTTLADVDVTDESAKLKIDEFLNRNQLSMPTSLGRIFKITEEEGVVYRLFIKNVLVLSFNEKGEWIHAEIEKEDDSSSIARLLSKIAGNELPTSISEAIRTQNNLGDIRIIALYGNGEYGLRFENKDLLIDESTGIVPPPVSSANKIAAYFNSSYKLVYPDGMSMVSPYEYGYTFVYDNDNKDNISIELTQDGVWTKISASHIAEDLKVTPLSLPSKIVELLPAKAVDYLNQNYQDGHIYILRHQNNEYNVYVDQQYSLYFNEEGTFLRQNS